MTTATEMGSAHGEEEKDGPMAWETLLMLTAPTQTLSCTASGSHHPRPEFLEVPGQHFGPKTLKSGHAKTEETKFKRSLLKPRALTPSQLSHM